MMIRILFFLLLISGCVKKSEHAETEVFEIRTIAKEVQIPKILMDELVTEVSGDSKTITPVYMFMPLQVQFKEKSEGALSKPAMKYSFPKGGGYLDLKDIVTGSGSFYLSFPSEQFDENLEFLHLYYISNSPVKKIEDEEFGLGCGKMVDLKKSFKKLQNPEFLKLNTTAQRYLYVASGQYIFVFRRQSQVYMAQLTLADSRYKNELCVGVNL